MVRDGNVADLPLFFCLQRRVVQTVLAARLRTEGRIVELVNVDVVGLERVRRLVSRSRQKPSAVCAPVLVASTIRSRIPEKAAPTFCSLSEYARAVSKKLMPPSQALCSSFTASVSLMR